jgi:diguanylate cyclase (GGDEF)-like protein/PAS domain S-box-containing protein
VNSSSETQITQNKTNLVLFLMQIVCIYFRKGGFTFRLYGPFFSSVFSPGMLNLLCCSQITFAFARMASSSCQWVSSPLYGRAYSPPSIAGYRPARTDLPKMLPQPGPNPLLEAFLSDPDQAVIGFGLDGAVFLWNPAAELLYGFTQAEVLGKSVACLLPLYELPAHEELLHNPSCTESRVDSVAERLDRSGLRISVRIHRSPIRDAHGEIIGIPERAHVLAVGNTCSVAEAHLCLLVEQIPLFFWTTDSRLHITSHWGRTASLPRSFPRYPVGQTIHQYLRCQEDSEPPVKQHILALRGISSRLEYASRNRIYDLGIGPYRDPQGLVIGCIGMALDITERKKTEDEIRFRASHDGLTGLANYREFFESLEREVRRAERTRQPFALLLLDLDDLKHINDRHGHLTGNRALNRLARVMKEHCRGTETAARYGGDEFAILLLDANGERAQNVAERISSCLRRQTDSPVLSVSIGFSVYANDGVSAPELLEAADKRLYQSKKSRAFREPKTSPQRTESART